MTSKCIAIRITRKTTSRAPNGAGERGVIKAYRGSKKVGHCDWSGNQGEAAALNTVAGQVGREVGPDFTLVDQDQLGDEVRTQYRNGAPVYEDAAY